MPTHTRIIVVLGFMLLMVVPVSGAQTTDIQKKSPNLVVLLDVPFISQAPLGHWSDPRQEHGCEEASTLMAVAWARGKTFSKQAAERELIKISDDEEKKYGSYNDTSLADTVERLFKQYYAVKGAFTRFTITPNDIIAELRKGNVVLIQVNGRKLKNPFFTPPGPVEHMLAVIGYDPIKNEFITNDPGTRHGKHYRYPARIIQAALAPYPTTGKKSDRAQKTGMIVVSKKK